MDKKVKDAKQPTAKAKADKTDVKVGDTVTVNGSESTDPDKNGLSYKWEIKPPEGSSVKNGKQDNTTKLLTFTADKPGAYVVKLIVNDGRKDSDPSEVTINAN